MDIGTTKARAHGPKPFSHEPSPRQLEVLEHIVDAIEQTGRPPTYRELMLRLGVRSLNGVADHIDALDRKGLIARPRRLVARGTHPTQRGLDALRRPRANATRRETS